MGPGDWLALVALGTGIGAGVAFGNRLAEYLVSWWEGWHARHR